MNRTADDGRKRCTLNATPSNYSTQWTLPRPVEPLNRLIPRGMHGITNARTFATDVRARLLFSLDSPPHWRRTSPRDSSRFHAKRFCRTVNSKTIYVSYVRVTVTRALSSTGHLSRKMAPTSLLATLVIVRTVEHKPCSPRDEKIARIVRGFNSSA